MSCYGLLALLLCGIASASDEEAIIRSQIQAFQVTARVFDDLSLVTADRLGRYGPRRCSYYNCLFGYCYYGRCKCSYGWTGDMCNQCIPRPDCVMGYCTKPGECICESGYFGFRCDHEDGGFIGEEHVSNSEQSVDSVEDSSEFLSAS